jgi:hypothetical protein
MSPEERKEAIRAFQKENNKRILKKLRLPFMLILLGIGYIFLVDYVFDFPNKWISLPGALLIILSLFILENIFKEWDKVPDFEDDPVLDSKTDKLITFFTGYFLGVPFFTLLILNFWTCNFYSQFWFWSLSIGFGLIFSNILYKILKKRIADFEQYNKQRLEELGRLWILFLLTGMVILQCILLGFTFYQNGEIMAVQQQLNPYKIKYNGSWVNARYSKDEYNLIKEKDSIHIEVVPIFFGIKYFKNFDSISTNNKIKSY